MIKILFYITYFTALLMAWIIITEWAIVFTVVGLAVMVWQMGKGDKE